MAIKSLNTQNTTTDGSTDHVTLPTPKRHEVPIVIVDTPANATVSVTNAKGDPTAVTLWSEVSLDNGAAELSTGVTFVQIEASGGDVNWIVSIRDAT